MLHSGEMGMFVEWWEDPRTGDLTFKGRVSKRDLEALKLDRIDIMVLGEPILTAADLFQNLEIIARRLLEQQPSAVILDKEKGVQYRG
jgi:hypothetical protein